MKQVTVVASLVPHNVMGDALLILLNQNLYLKMFIKKSSRKLTLILFLICLIHLFSIAIIYNLHYAKIIYRDIILFLYYFIFYLILSKFWILRTWKKVLITLSLGLLIDASVIFTNPLLIPLRFPFATLFSFIGVGLAYLFQKSIKLFNLTIFIVIGFFYLSHSYIIPSILNNSQEASLKTDINFFSASLTNEKGEKV